MKQWFAAFTVYAVIMLCIGLNGCSKSDAPSNPFSDDASNENQARGSYSGQVLDPNASALSGVNVSMLATGAVSGGYASVSDSAGRFRVPDVIGGSYVATFSKSGYRDTSFNVTIGIAENKTMSMPLVLQYSNMQARDINGNVVGNTARIDSVVSYLTGDGIDSTNPLRKKLTWLPVSRRFTGIVNTPQNGVVWTVSVKLFCKGRVIGFSGLMFDAGAGNISIPDFDAENAMPSVEITAPIQGAVFSDSATTGVAFSAIAVDTIKDTLNRILVNYPGGISLVRWDFNGDNTFDTTLTGANQSSIVHRFPKGHMGTCIVEAEDIDGNTSRDSMEIAIVVAKAVSAGWEHSLLVLDNGMLFATGYNGYGALGTGKARSVAANDHQFDPAYDETRFRRIMTGVSKSMAGGYSSAALKTDGTLWTWGYNGEGQLGQGLQDGRIYTPAKILENVKDFFIDRNHVIALKNDGTVWHAGDSLFYNDGSRKRLCAASRTPAQILSGVMSISGGDNQLFLARFRSDSLVIFKDSDSRELSIADIIVYDTSFLPIVKQIAVCRSVQMGLSFPSFQFVRSTTPPGILMGMTVAQNQYGMDTMAILCTDTGVLSFDVGKAGSPFALYVKATGQLMAVGANNHGQFGDGTTNTSSTPVPVTQNVISVSCGDMHSFIIKNDGKLYASGWNVLGNLGIGNTFRSNGFTPVTSLTW